MTPEKLLAWFKEIGGRNIGTPNSTSVGSFYDEASIAWRVDAESALAQAFPAKHPVVMQWHALYAGAGDHEYKLREKSRVSAWRTIFSAAGKQLEAGQLQSLADGITAENVSELLDQAKTLLPTHYLAAGVIIGGTLETFLNHLCVKKHGLTVNGNTISAYQAALAEHRKSTGTEIVSQVEEKQITAWGGLRNEAAHTPLVFTSNRNGKDVEHFLEGVRNFINKHS